MPTDDQIRRVYAQERSGTPTGKYKVSEDRRKRVLRGFKKALEERDASAFEQPIRDLGLQPGSAEYARAWSLWQTAQKRGG